VTTLADRVSYVGSSEHKTGLSFAGLPRPRADATICDVALNDRAEDIRRWLQDGIRHQSFGPPWEDGFPRYVWCKIDDTVYEARLVNRGLGQYKGWQLNHDEWPDGINNIDWNASDDFVE
jgi:hypothetical protein